MKKQERETIAQNVESQQSGLFHTYDSLEELIEAQNLHGCEVTAVYLAANTITQQIANKIRNKEI